LLDEFNELRHIESRPEAFSEADTQAVIRQVKDLRQEPEEHDFIIAWHNSAAPSFMYRKVHNGAFVVVFRHRSEIPKVRRAVARAISGSWPNEGG
jgi:hypothetical protein